ncbi:PQQ-dependent sugar dehydrogenase [Halostagnicola sp. A-GB9-2]|uniref:PQQ-dependent sugar dehydrogenase n=1 Tax=Halostagnicola sp. A-GB9-2 TaxID=3048066 RepID=UPI0024BF3BCD|nr:PQQ-dependent sugar dehydrogenase [Halostagnicola sp. A-GB9-2]MDJ1432031.1 PQQ-dependent sugar dehydrogenase [Halostagnicola sp. A-GB9-2]
MDRPSRRRFIQTVGATSTLFAGCLEDSNETELTEPGDAPEYEWSEPSWEPADGVPTETDVESTTVVSGLEIPWDLTFADDDAFVTERDGGVRRFDADSMREDAQLEAADGEVILEATDLPDRSAPGEGGTLGLAVHPSYPDELALFVYYTVDTGEIENRVVRYDLETEDLEPILEGIPGATTHNGGRITFGPQDDLWVTTGDAETPALTQDPSSLAGAILRVTTDGDPVSGNPNFGDESDSRTYSLGHRNPQGIDFCPDGVPFVAEHGPVARDEISIVNPGGNYGWDVLRGGPDDPEYEAYGDGEYDEVTPPVLNTGPDKTWAPSGIDFYDSDTIPNWKNRLFVCGLTSETLYAVSLSRDDEFSRTGNEAESNGSETSNGDGSEETRDDGEWLDDRLTATAQPLFGDEYGRLRHVEQGPDGTLYLLTSNRDGRADGEFPLADDDRIVRLEPS